MNMATTLQQATNKISQAIYIFLNLVVALPGSVLAQATFTDVTKAAGIDHQFGIYDGTFGGGASILDLDNDGWEDIFLPGGMNRDLLLRNNHDGTFTDIYEESGLVESAGFVTQGAACADVNKDGWVDILITTITSKLEKKEIPRAPNLLFLNNGNSTFRNATEEFGLINLLSFSQGACFGDVNADGYPDLYIGNYFREFEGQLNITNDAIIVSSNQLAQGYLLINHDGEYFLNEYNEYGMSHKGFGFGGAFTDFDNDSDLDLLVNHDFGYKAKSNLLLRNEYPEPLLSDISKEQEMNLRMNAMGVAVGDYNNDGLLDYYVTNIRANHFMVNQGVGKPFVNKAKELGVGFNKVTDKRGSTFPISWGTNFADFDNDTDLDLFVANGCLNPAVVPIPDFYFENDNGVFIERSEAAGLHDYGIGRGSVVFDYDNDGDLDLLVVNQNPVETGFQLESATKFYRNDTEGRSWTKISLNGTDSDTRGLGARVEIVIGKLKMIREIDGGSSHLSQSSSIAHFGLGEVKLIDSVIVKWIGGEKQILLNQPANTLIQVSQPPAENLLRRIIIFASISALTLSILIVVIIRISKRSEYLAWQLGRGT